VELLRKLFAEMHRYEHLFESWELTSEVYWSILDAFCIKFRFSPSTKYATHVFEVTVTYKRQETSLFVITIVW